MNDIVKVIKQLISSNPSLKQKLLAQGIITEKDGDIIILKPEAFEIVSSNSPGQTGEKQEWLKQTPQSVDPSASLLNSVFPFAEEFFVSVADLRGNLVFVSF